MNPTWLEATTLFPCDDCKYQYSSKVYGECARICASCRVTRPTNWVHWQQSSSEKTAEKREES